MQVIVIKMFFKNWRQHPCLLRYVAGRGRRGVGFGPLWEDLEEGKLLIDTIQLFYFSSHSSLRFKNQGASIKKPRIDNGRC